jgi:hypothetical protein
MSMHANTLAIVIQKIHEEISNDPESRGYANKTVSEITNLLNEPIAIIQPPMRRNVEISDVEGYLHGRLAMVSLIDWTKTEEAKSSPAYSIARTLVEVLTAGRLRFFLTENEVKRNNILGMFDVLVSVGVPGMTKEVRDGLEAMTFAPIGVTLYSPSRWLCISEDISAEPTPEPTTGENGELINNPGYSGPPNIVTEEIVMEAV